MSLSLPDDTATGRESDLLCRRPSLKPPLLSSLTRNEATLVVCLTPGLWLSWCLTLRLTAVFISPSEPWTLLEIRPLAPGSSHPPPPPPTALHLVVKLAKYHLIFANIEAATLCSMEVDMPHIPYRTRSSTKRSRSPSSPTQYDRPSVCGIARSSLQDFSCTSPALSASSLT